MKLDTTFDGLALDNPLMPASGPLVGDLEKLLFMADAGCGAIVTKTISTHLPKIPKPCIFAGKQHVMNSELWSEYPLSRWTDEFLPGFMEQKDRPLIVSVGYSAKDMETLIPALDPFADAFEVSTHYVGTDLENIAQTVKAIRARTLKPIYMKVSPHMPDPAAFAKTIMESGASGVVAVNSLGPTMNIDISRRRVLYSNDQGYVWTSGPAIKPLALATVHKIREAAPDMTVIGVGGIESADDVIEFLLAGADAVQMLSGALLKGKSLYAKIIKDLPERLKHYGFESVEDVIRAKLDTHATYEADVPVLIEDKCIRCNLCVDVCPYFAITMKDVITFDPKVCTQCGLCVTKCPTKAIVMPSEETR
jgi:dihydroorotate dehydrogenase subfamily 1